VWLCSAVVDSPINDESPPSGLKRSYPLTSLCPTHRRAWQVRPRRRSTTTISARARRTTRRVWATDCARLKSAGAARLHVLDCARLRPQEEGGRPGLSEPAVADRREIGFGWLQNAWLLEALLPTDCTARLSRRHLRPAAESCRQTVSLNQMIFRWHTICSTTRKAFYWHHSQ
jgi:hypothetical protein